MRPFTNSRNQPCGVKIVKWHHFPVIVFIIISCCRIKRGKCGTAGAKSSIHDIEMAWNWSSFKRNAATNPRILEFAAQKIRQRRQGDGSYFVTNDSHELNLEAAHRLSDRCHQPESINQSWTLDEKIYGKLDCEMMFWVWVYWGTVHLLIRSASRPISGLALQAWDGLRQ